MIFLAASQPGLSLIAAHPPQRLGTQDGLAVYHFADHADWPVYPAIIVHSLLQPAPDAQWLGGPYWRIESAQPIEAALEWRAEGILAFPDVVLPHVRRDFDDPSYGGQWYLQSLSMPQLYESSLGDPDVRVAVIDSGIDIHHLDLEAAVQDPYDAWSDDDDPSPEPGEYCNDGSQDICDEHGTAVSGIILARANNQTGIVGMCPQCTLIPIKLLGEGPGRGMSADIAAFEHAIAADVGVINNSWGFTEATPVPDLLAEVIHRAATEPRGGRGALVIFAAGNDDRELGPDEMESLEDIVCVSASDSYGRPTNYTNYGDAIDISAPSATVTIAPENTVITNFGGTSAAAPVASGLAAWALSVDPELSAQELHELMVDTAIQSPLVIPDANGHDPYFGYGEMSALGVWDVLLGGSKPDASEPEEAKACGCAAAKTQSGWGLLAGLLLFLYRRR